MGAVQGEQVGDKRPIRVGHQLRPSGSIDEIVAEAKAAEAAGFDTITLPDHVNETLWSPLVLLAAIARETSTIRLGTFVINNEMRNPVQLAWEVSTLDRLSNGRFELGIGAGHTPSEFAATGIALDDAPIRKRRLAEAVEIIRPLLDGEVVNYAGEYYTIENAQIERTVQDRLPILVGGNGEALLTHAGEHADIVGLNGLRKTMADGHRHSVGFGLDRLEQQIGWVHNGATGREKAPELNVLVQRVEITNDRRGKIEELLDVDFPTEGLTVEHGLVTPYLAFGSHDEIAAQFIDHNERFGISYFVTRDIDAMTPVVDRLRATD